MQESRAFIPFHCPPESIAYCRPLKMSISGEASQLRVVQVAHNLKLLNGTRPKIRNSDYALEVGICLYENKETCVRSDTMIEHAENLLQSIRRCPLII